MEQTDGDDCQRHGRAGQERVGRAGQSFRGRSGKEESRISSLSDLTEGLEKSEAEAAILCRNHLCSRLSPFDNPWVMGSEMAARVALDPGA